MSIFLKAHKAWKVVKHRRQLSLGKSSVCWYCKLKTKPQIWAFSYKHKVGLDC